MNFLSFSIKLTNMFSSLMGISSPVNFVSGLGPSSADSPNNFFQTILTIVVHTIKDLFEYAIETIIKLVYAIVKWILTAIDFLFIMIRQMIGMNGDFSDTDSLTESDMIFKFVFNDEVIRVIKGMIGYAILLLILFSIFAIIKNEYDFAVNGGSNSKKQVLTSALKSLFLMILVPMLFIGGVLLSTAIGKTIYIATAGGMDTMLGPQIFTASTYDSNLYRRYVRKNFKIPITFSFDEISDKDNVGGWGTDGEIAELDEALQAFNSSDAWNRGMTTFLMFYTDGFLLQDNGSNGVDHVSWKLDGDFYVKNEETSYNFTFDKNIYSCRDQYSVMADVLDYGVKTETKFFYKTPEQLYESIKISQTYDKMPTAEKQIYDVFFANTQTDVYVKYPAFDKKHKLVHTLGARSESEGAVYVLCTEKTINITDAVLGDVTYSYYYPVLHYGEEDVAVSPRVNDEGNAVGAPNPVIAKGLFSEEGYPTAIKEEDGVIKFYRDDLNVPAIMDFFPTISYEMPEGAFENPAVSLLKKGVSAITGVDITQFIPYIYYNIDIFSLFTKKTYDIVTLSDGYLKVNYNFTQDGYVMTNLYSMLDVNLVILLFASILLIGMLFKVLFGVAHRVMDVTLLAITYPAVLATYTLDNGSRFKNWSKTMIQKILSIYGVIVGVNLILLLISALENVSIFRPEDFGATNINIASYTAGFINGFIRLLFMLVAFTMLERATALVENIFSGQSVTDKKGNPNPSALIKDGEQTVNDLKKVPALAATVVSGKLFMEIGTKVASAAASMIPGAAAAKEVIDFAQHKKQMHDAKKEVKQAKKDIKDAKNAAKQQKQNTPDQEQNQNDQNQQDNQDNDNNQQDNQENN